jgi:phage shock protein PspC (stress-responsive transcriptional regulator)
LFRDPERQKIAGVCAGLQHYVGMDITAMRASAWMFSSLESSAAVSSTLVFLLYIILWQFFQKQNQQQIS